MKEPGARRGVEHIRTARNQSLRSIPQKQDDYSYLDSYILGKERERLENELSYVGKRGGRASKRLEEIKSKMEDMKRKLEDAKNEEEAKETVNGTSREKDWRVMKIDY